jgi:hypothetical protein
MFSEHSFCESPFSSYIEIELNGEIFYFNLAIEQSIDLDLNISRSQNFVLEIEQDESLIILR